MTDLQIFGHTKILLTKSVARETLNMEILYIYSK